MAELLHELILESACRTPAALVQQVRHAAGGLLALGLQAQDRVAVWLDKRIAKVNPEVNPEVSP